MIFLPKESDLVKSGLEKIDTYLVLSKLSCPVFKSVLIYPNETINQEMIYQLQEYFRTEEVTIRYQYIKPTTTPVQGGNRYRISLETILPLQNNDTILWVLEPINRLKNDFGINLYFHADICTIEIVGKGFDVSDLNRGQISPHQTITSSLPIEFGYFNEWWKFLQFTFASKNAYEQSKLKRIQKLTNMGYSVSTDIFNERYLPISMEKLEELLTYIVSLNNNLIDDDYCVSCSISNNKFVFWDIQTPNGKKRTYGVK